MVAVDAECGPAEIVEAGQSRPTQHSWRLVEQFQNMLPSRLELSQIWLLQGGLGEDRLEEVGSSAVCILGLGRLCTALGRWGGCNLLGCGQSRLQPKLELRLGRSIELLVDGGVGRVESNVVAGRVGESFKLGFRARRDLEKESQFLGQNMGTKITKSELETPILAVDEDLDGDESIGPNKASIGGWVAHLGCLADKRRCPGRGRRSGRRIASTPGRSPHRHVWPQRLTQTTKVI